MKPTYAAYAFGRWLAVHLPWGAAYWIAERIADVHCLCSPQDRRAVRHNLQCILGRTPPDLERQAREVFRNFARYLVDFLRAGKVDAAFIRRHIAIEGLTPLREAIARHGGAIIVSAHLGNWELAGIVTTLLGCPVSAVALDHKDARVNALFVEHRRQKGMEVISATGWLRRCYGCLKEGRALALVGDRDVTGHGRPMLLFGQTLVVPEGPAVLSLRTGAPIVPAFLTQEGRFRYRMVFEPPMHPVSTGSREQDVLRLMQTYLAVIERYVRRYPTQWFIFQPLQPAHAPEAGPDALLHRYSGV